MSANAAFSLLLGEEFDARPAPSPDLDALLAAAREAARAEVCAGCAAREVQSRQALAASCAALASGLGDALAALDAALEEGSRILAETIVAAIGAALPGWQARLDRTATAAIATTLLAALGENARPRLFVSPGDAAGLRALLPADIALEADAAMAPGALHLAWRNGRAVRDPGAIWNDIAATLAAALAPVATRNESAAATE